MKRTLKWLLLLTLVITVGIAIILSNPGMLKGPLENYLSNLTGYSISLAGDLDISAGKQLSLSVTKVHVFNQQGTSEHPLVVLGSMDLVVDGASLFADTVEVVSLQVDDLQISLATSADGVGNWVTDKHPSAAAQTKKREPMVIFSQLKLSNTNLVFFNGETGKDFELDITSYDQQQRHDGMLEINLNGSLNQHLVEYAGTVGTYRNLLAGTNVAFNGDGHFGSLTLTAEGVIDDLLDPQQPQFKIDLQGPDTDDITGMLEIDDLGTGEFSLRARGETTNGQYSAGIHGSMGDLSLNLTAEASDLLALDTVNLSVAVNGPRLGAATRALGIKHWPDKPFSLMAKANRAGKTLNISELSFNIGASELKLDAVLTNFPELNNSRINLAVEGDDVVQFRQLLGISGVATGPFSVHGKLDTGADNLELIQLEVKTSLGQAILSGTLGPGPDYIGTKLHVNMDGHDANLLMTVFGIDALPQDPFKLDARVELLQEGLRVERGVLVSIDDDRLEFGGLIAMKPGGEGSDFDFRLTGDNLSQMLGRMGSGLELPASAYALAANVRLLDAGVEIKNLQADFEAIKLTAEGLLVLDDQLNGTALDFQLSGKNLSALHNFAAVGDALELFVPGQAYRAGGRISVADNGFQLENIAGQVGKTEFKFDSLLSPPDNWSGSSAHISISGPDLHALLKDRDASELPLGSFSTSAVLKLTGNKFNISDLSIETDRINGRLDLQLDWPLGSSSNVNFNMDIQGGDIRHLIPQSEAFKPSLAVYKIHIKGQHHNERLSLQKFEANIGGLQVSLHGEVGDDSLDQNMDITFRVVADDISTLGQLNGEALPALAMDVVADFDGNASEFSIHNLNGKLGESRVSGQLAVSLKGSRPAINLSINSPYLDLRPFLAGTDPKTGGSTTNNSSRMIPATPLSLESLKLIDGNFKLNISEIRYQRDSLRNLAIEASISNGGLKISKATGRGPRGSFNVTLSLLPSTKGRAAMQVNLHARDLQLNLLGQSKERLHQLPLIDLDLNLKGKGGNLQELAGSLNGAASIGSSGGVLEDANLSMLDTFFLEKLIRGIMPDSDNEEDLNITCAASILKVTNGLIETDPALAFTTNKITLIAKGELDLKTEKMHFNFNTIPNKAYKFSASELINPFILVSGTLKNPSIVASV